MYNIPSARKTNQVLSSQESHAAMAVLKAMTFGGRVVSTSHFPLNPGCSLGIRTQLGRTASPNIPKQPGFFHGFTCNYPTQEMLRKENVGYKQPLS